MQAPTTPAPRIDPPTLVVHGVTGLRSLIAAAGEANLHRLRLLSAPDAACFLGPAWWRALMAIAASLCAGTGIALEDVLDCGDAAGRALEALRLGQRALVLERTPQWPTVGERAAATGAMLLDRRPVAFDPAGPGADRQLGRWLRDAAAADDRGSKPV